MYIREFRKKIKEVYFNVTERYGFEVGHIDRLRWVSMKERDRLFEQVLVDFENTLITMKKPVRRRRWYYGCWQVISVSPLNNGEHVFGFVHLTAAGKFAERHIIGDCYAFKWQIEKGMYGKSVFTFASFDD